MEINEAKRLTQECLSRAYVALNEARKQLEWANKFMDSADLCWTNDFADLDEHLAAGADMLRDEIKLL